MAKDDLISSEDIELLDEETGEFRPASVDVEQLDIDQGPAKALSESFQKGVKAKEASKSDFEKEMEANTGSMMEAAGAGALQSGTLGFADELYGATKSGVPYEQARDEARSYFKGQQESRPAASMFGSLLGTGVSAMAMPAVATRPVSSLLSKVPGLAEMLGTAKVAAPAIESLPIAQQAVAQAPKFPTMGQALARTGVGAAEGALQGGVAGAGFSEADTSEVVLQDALSSAKFGGKLGGGLAGGIEGVRYSLGQLPAVSKIARDMSAGYGFGKQGVDLSDIRQTEAAGKKLLDLGKETQEVLTKGAGSTKEKSAKELLNIANVLSTESREAVEGGMLPERQQKAIKAANDILDFVSESKSKVGKDISAVIEKAQAQGKTLDVTDLVNELQKTLAEKKTYVGDEKRYANQIRKMLNDYKDIVKPEVTPRPALDPLLGGPRIAEEVPQEAKRAILTPQQLQTLKGDIGELAFETPQIEGKLKKPLTEAYRKSGEALEQVVSPEDLPALQQANKQYTALSEAKNIVGEPDKLRSLGRNAPSPEALNMASQTGTPSELSLLDVNNRQNLKALLGTVDPAKAEALMNQADTAAKSMNEATQVLGDTTVNKILSTVSKAYKGGDQKALLDLQVLTESLKKALPPAKVDEYIQQAQNLSAASKMADETLQFAETNPDLLKQVPNYMATKAPGKVLEGLESGNSFAPPDVKSKFNELLGKVEQYNPELSSRIQKETPDIADQLRLSGELAQKQSVGDIRELRGSLLQLASKSANKAGLYQSWLNSASKADAPTLDRISTQLTKAGLKGLGSVFKSLVGKDQIGRNATIFALSQDPKLRKEFDEASGMLGLDQGEVIDEKDIEIVE